MTNPRDDIAGLIEELNLEIERAGREWCYFPLISKAATQLDALSADRNVKEQAIADMAHTIYELRNALSARVKELEAERQEVREILAGSDYGSLPDDWTLAQVAGARMENISKLRWQVKDTCSRAEAAEARAARLQQERDEAYERAAKAAFSWGVSELNNGDLTDVQLNWYLNEIGKNIAAAIRRLAAGPEKEGEL